MGRNETRESGQRYPDFLAELEEIEAGGITPELVERLIKKHGANAAFNKKLFDRYAVSDVPILERQPRFDDEPSVINNRINNDFFSEIVDFKTGYFAGKPIAYGYSDTLESDQDTGGGEKRERAKRMLTDFTSRNNMHDLDMEATKYAAIAGYAGRLFYHDKQGNERAIILYPYQCIILSRTEVYEPEYALRYYQFTGGDEKTVIKAEFYDAGHIWYYQGEGSSFSFVKKEPHLFGCCPLQGIVNNSEMMGDAEKVLQTIDAYDRALSDANNESESFANAYMVFENVNITQEEMEKGQKAGAFSYFKGGSAEGKIYFLTKDINDDFIEHHLDRLEANIYRFSKTPNLNDLNFSQNASGVSLKFKLTGLESKCGMFEAKLRSAGMYMFQLLGGCYRKKQIAFEPLQCVMDFHRNFPQDILSEAQAVDTLIRAGLPLGYAFGKLSDVDDADHLLQMKEREEDREEETGYQPEPPEEKLDSEE